MSQREHHAIRTTPPPAPPVAARLLRRFEPPLATTAPPPRNSPIGGVGRHAHSRCAVSTIREGQSGSRRLLFAALFDRLFTRQGLATFAERPIVLCWGRSQSTSSSTHDRRREQEGAPEAQRFRPASSRELRRQRERVLQRRASFFHLLAHHAPASLNRGMRRSTQEIPAPEITDSRMAELVELGFALGAMLATTLKPQRRNSLAVRGGRIRARTASRDSRGRFIAIPLSPKF
jgi:hypothetical protein